MTNRLFDKQVFLLVLFISLLFLSVPHALALGAIGNWNWFNGGVVSIDPAKRYVQTRHQQKRDEQWKMDEY